MAALKSTKYLNHISIIILTMLMYLNILKKSNICTNLVGPRSLRHLWFEGNYSKWKNP